MKMKKLARVFTSAALVSAMVATMGGMTAFAEDTTIDFAKTVTTDGKTYAPDTSFEFTLAPATEHPADGVAGSNGLTGIAAGTVISDGVAGGLEFVEVTDAENTDTNGSTEKTGNGLNASITFKPVYEDGEGAHVDPKDKYVAANKIAIKAKEDVFKAEGPGIYHYTVTETVKEDYEGLRNDIHLSRDIYVYVGYPTKTDGEGNAILGENLEILDVIVAKNGTKVDKVNFINNYGNDLTEPDDPDDPKNDGTHDVTISKKVTGNQGNKTKKFNFEITVNSDNSDRKEPYYIIYTTKAGETKTHQLSGDKGEYALADGESVTINGLSKNDTYTILEKEANQDGYVTTYAGDNDAPQNAKVSTDKSTMEVVNNRDVTTPTGIVLSFAPYILLVALAGVFGVLFLRRKKEEF